MLRVRLLHHHRDLGQDFLNVNIFRSQPESKMKYVCLWKAQYIEKYLEILKNYFCLKWRPRGGGGDRIKRSPTC